MSDKDKQKIKKFENNTKKICVKRTNKKKRKNTWKNKKNQSNNGLKKIKENDELKRVEVDVIPNFIKDEVEIYSVAEVYTDDDKAEGDSIYLV